MKNLLGYKRFLFILFGVLLFPIMQAQSFKMNLYRDGEIPNYKDVGEVEVWDTTNSVRIGKVQVPEIQVFLPPERNRTGEAIVICPGGGYSILSWDWEGEEVAKFWNSKGVAAIVLKSRLPSEAQVDKHRSPLMDAQRAMRIARYHAKEWGYRADRIGIMGFSAGGHLASSASTHFTDGYPNSADPIERLSCRPDFSILVYPVITFTQDFQHEGSRKNLVGNDKELMEYFSSELQVTEQTPPAILIHASDDKAVPVENSIAYYMALKENGISAEMHIYPEGGHGFGLAVGRGQLSGWPERCYEWLVSLR